MLGALIYLRLTSARNWLWSRLRRLRQPKYLFGAFVGFAYFYFFFFRPMAPPPPRAGGRLPAEVLDASLPLEWLPILTAMGGLMLLGFMTLVWIVPTRRAALGFSEAEIAFLFPAPITRKALVHFRLLSAQLRSFVGAAVMMLFSNRWATVGGNPLTHAIGWWFIFSALNLHFTGATFTLTRLADNGLSPWRRRALLFVLVATIVGTSIARVTAPAPELANMTDFRPATAWLLELSTTAPLLWVLWPLTLVIGPFLAIDTHDFLLALTPALGVLTLHYIWVVHTAVAFEDASIDWAQKRGARAAAWRTGDRRMSASVKGRANPFRLPGTGRPELAFFWKNLLSAWPYFTLRTLLGCAALITAGCLWMGSHPEWRAVLPGVGAFALVFGAYTLIVGPQFARQDLRSDFINADILKTYPLQGWQVILGQLLTPVAILSGVLWLIVLTAALSFVPTTHALGWLTPQLRIAIALGLALIIPAAVMLQMLVPNAAALIFPAWFQISRNQGGGPEVIGQRMIFFFAQLLTMLLALVPALGMAALFIIILQWLIGPVVAVLVAAVAVVIVLIAEIGCGLWWLGRRFEKLDLSVELRS